MITKTGDTFGRWTVVEPNLPVRGQPKSVRMSMCRCAGCGRTKKVWNCNLANGSSTGCRSCAMKGHGLVGTPSYRSWYGMKQRCTNPKSPKYKDYGGRGITVCDRWMSFNNFFEDMGQRSAGMSLDRIDNNGIYEPGNCRWANYRQQARNTRRSRILSSGGVSMCITAWADHLGISRSTIDGRLDRGWPIDKALAATTKGAQQ